MNKQIIAIIAVAAMVGGGSFYGGMKYAQSSGLSSGRGAAAFANLSPEERQARMQQFGGSTGGVRGGTQGGGFVSGEVIASDSKSITVKLRDGGSKIIFFSDSTEIGKFVTGAASDLAVGKTVNVTGKANSDGSITAQSIQIRP